MPSIWWARISGKREEKKKKKKRKQGLVVDSRIQRKQVPIKSIRNSLSTREK